MKDYVQSCHLTKFDAFKINRDQVIDLETWFKIHTNICNVGLEKEDALKRKRWRVIVGEIADRVG